MPERFHVEYGKNKETGEENKFQFVLTVNKPFNQESFGEIAKTDGVNHTEVAGRYSAIVLVAKTFNPDEVIEDIKTRLAPFTSDIILASSGDAATAAQKILTGGFGK